MKIAISAESTIDLPESLRKKFDIQTVPFTVLLGENSALDGVITPNEIFAYVDDTGVLPKTSAVNEYQFNEHFDKLLEEYDAVIHFSLSSEISSACANAKAAASIKKNVYVIDTRSLSTGIALQAIYARKLAEEGLDPKEIVKKCEKRIPFDQTSFVIKTLDYLYKGGRCSGAARFASTVFRIKPQILVKDGKMFPGKKYIGKFSQCIRKYVKDTLEEFNNPDPDVVFVTHTMANPEVVKETIKLLKENGFKNVYETTVGATISSHCGPKCLGILYMNEGEQKD